MDCYRPLRGEESLLLIDEHQVFAAIDDEIEVAVRPAPGFSELRVTEGAEANALERLAFGIQDPTPQHADASGIEGVLVEAPLERVITGVEEARRVEEIGGNSAVEWGQSAG